MVDSLDLFGAEQALEFAKFRTRCGSRLLALNFLFRSLLFFFAPFTPPCNKPFEFLSYLLKTFSSHREVDINDQFSKDAEDVLRGPAFAREGKPDVALVDTCDDARTVHCMDDSSPD